MKLLNPFLINNFYAWLIAVLIDTTGNVLVICLIFAQYSQNIH